MNEITITENDMLTAFNFATDKAAETKRNGKTQYDEAFDMIAESAYFNRAVDVAERMINDLSVKWGLVNVLAICLSEVFLVGFYAGQKSVPEKLQPLRSPWHVATDDSAVPV